MADGIIVEGRTFPLRHPVTGERVPVRAWNDPPGSGARVPEFHAGDGFNKRRVRWPVDLFVHHWTGGEGEPEAVAEVLRQRKLGVEFAISRAGVVYQFCDPALVDTADAGFVNSRSVGCEIVNYGFRDLVFDPVRALRVGPLVPKLGKDRETYTARIHGRTRTLARFYLNQINAAIALAEAFSGAVPSVSRRVPVDAAGQLVGNVIDVANFTGHVGHFHLTERKLDPGFDLLEALRVYFSRGGVA